MSDRRFADQQDPYRPRDGNPARSQPDGEPPRETRAERRRREEREAELEEERRLRSRPRAEPRVEPRAEPRVEPRVEPDPRAEYEAREQRRRDEYEAHATRLREQEQQEYEAQVEERRRREYELQVEDKRRRDYEAQLEERRRREYELQVEEQRRQRALAREEARDRQHPPRDRDQREPARAAAAPPARRAAAMEPPRPEPAPHHDDAEEGELGFLIEDEDDDSGRGGRRRRLRGGRKRGPFGVLIALVVVAALVIGIFYGGRAIIDIFSDVPDYTGQGTGEVRVRVETGDSLSTIATTLQKADVIKSTRAFTDAAEGVEAATNIQPGLYQLRKQMKAAAALDLMLKPESKLVNRLVLPEGLTTDQTLAEISKATALPVEELKAALLDPNIGIPAWATALSPTGLPEGVLYPTSYEFDPEQTAFDVMQTVVAQFTEVAAEVNLEAGAAALGRTPYEILTIASMIEKEAKVDEERAKISRVIFNRLDQNIALGIDATIVYAVGHSPLTATDLAIDSPYNSRTVKGLPPTPIANPGTPSLQAALAPADGTWIYYVLIDAEHHGFTDSAAEFEQLKQECVAAGLC